MSVVLVGAGPGDPDLLTVRGDRLLRHADVVVVDRLVDRRLLDLARPDALVIDVGKVPGQGDGAVAQEEINRVLVSHGRTGALVVRLKGGDPFLLGRGAEEVDALVAAGIDVEVVPGISSALGLPALAGIPVTHRGVAAAVTIASGHTAATGELPWAALSASDCTLVLLMAVEHRDRIATRLLDKGVDPGTPVAIIEHGATMRERRVVTSLASLGSLTVTAPAVIVIGAVASRMALDVTIPRTIARVPA